MSDWVKDLMRLYRMGVLSAGNPGHRKRGTSKPHSHSRSRPGWFRNEKIRRRRRNEIAKESRRINRRVAA